MTSDSGQSQANTVEQLQTFIVQRIKAGDDKSTITARIEEMGVERDQASRIVDSLYAEVMKAAESEAFSTRILPLAILGGVLSAIIGGAIWGGIVIYTGYEVGFVAWGLGFLCGLAVVLFSMGRKGVPLQVVAVVASIVGIMIGKYIAFHHYLKEYTLEQYGADVAANVSMFSGTVFSMFSESASSLLGGFDILWVVLAVITAWRIPQGMGITPPVQAPA